MYKSETNHTTLEQGSNIPHFSTCPGTPRKTESIPKEWANDSKRMRTTIIQFSVLPLLSP